MRNLALAVLVALGGYATDAIAIDRPRPQVTFRVNDTNVMLLVKSSRLSYAGRNSQGKAVTLFWSGSVKENGTVILLEPATSHSYEVLLRGIPGSRPELSIEFENWNNPPDSLRLQPTVGTGGTVKIDLWFMVHNEMGFIVPDRSSHWLPPPRPENVGVYCVPSGAEKGKFVLSWTQPRVMGMTNAVSFDARWSTGRISRANWDRTEQVTKLIGDKCEMDVSLLVANGARSFAIRAIDDRGQDSPISEPALVDGDNDGIPDIGEIERWGHVSKDATTDTDKDGVPDYMETIGLDPDNPDSDADGLPDGWETGNYLDPRKPDSSIDSDGDGFSNLEEYKAGTDIWDSHGHPTSKVPGRP